MTLRLQKGEEQLDNKIDAFMSRKNRQYPELELRIPNRG